MSQPPDQRQFSRVHWGSRATLHFPEGEREGPVRDISMNGVLVDAGASYPAGTPCRITIPLGTPPEAWIEAEGRVARSTDDGIALRFETMELDSAAHLRSLVTYNSPAPEEAEREVEHLRLWPEGGND